MPPIRELSGAAASSIGQRAATPEEASARTPTEGEHGAFIKPLWMGVGALVCGALFARGALHDMRVYQTGSAASAAALTGLGAAVGAGAGGLAHVSWGGTEGLKHEPLSTQLAIGAGVAAGAAGLALALRGGGSGANGEMGAAYDQYNELSELILTPVLFGAMGAGAGFGAGKLIE